MNFTIGECYYYYDEPLMVDGILEDGSLAVAIVMDETDDGSKWMITRVSAETLQGFTDNEISMLDTFITNAIGKQMTGVFYGQKDTTVQLEEIKGLLPKDWTWEPDVFLNPKPKPSEEPEDLSFLKNI